MTYHRQLAITNYKAIIQATVTSVKKQTAAEQLIAPAAVCYFLFGFLGNHPRSTRLACSFSSRMLHRQPAPSSPKRMDKIPWIKRAASRQSRPAIRNTGQMRWVKRTRTRSPGGERLRSPAAMRRPRQRLPSSVPSTSPRGHHITEKQMWKPTCCHFSSIACVSSQKSHDRGVTTAS